MRPAREGRRSGPLDVPGERRRSRDERCPAGRPSGRNSGGGSGPEAGRGWRSRGANGPLSGWIGGISSTDLTCGARSVNLWSIGQANFRGLQAGQDKPKQKESIRPGSFRGEMSVPLEAVEARRLYRQIADQLRGLIERGE